MGAAQDAPAVSEGRSNDDLAGDMDVVGMPLCADLGEASTDLPSTTTVLEDPLRNIWQTPSTAQGADPRALGTSTPRTYQNS